MTHDGSGFPVSRRTALRHVGQAAALPLAALPLLSRARPAWAETPSGKVSIEQIQISLLISAGWGHGTLYYQGSHPFSIKGLGVGGLGVSKLEAYGNVFRLKTLSDFGGVYGSVRSGAVATDVQLHGGLWMENPAGVQMHLVPRRVGLALNFGADGVLVTFDT